MRSKVLGIVFGLFVLWAFFCTVSFGATLYYTTNDGSSPSNLWSIDTDTYAQFDFGTIDARINGLSSSGIANTIYAADRANQRLLAIDVSTFPAAGSVFQFGTFGADIRGLAYDSISGTLYGRDNNQDLYTINTTTGKVDLPLIGNLGVRTMNGMTFDISGILYGIANDDILYTINTTTAGISAVNDPEPAINQITGIYVDPETDILYGVQRNDDDAFYSFGTNGVETRLADLSGVDARALAAPLPPETSLPIPTLSEWGMIIMGLVLAGYGLITLRKKAIVS